jgi:dihydrolipoamide dehydrogenase
MGAFAAELGCCCCCCCRFIMKVDYVKGWGTLKSPTEVDVALLDGSSTTIKTKNVLIATGSEVTPLAGVPVDEER